MNAVLAVLGTDYSRNVYLVCKTYLRVYMFVLYYPPC